MGAFNNYVDKMRGGGGQKMPVFVHAQGKKIVHAGMGGKKWQNSVHVVVECPLSPYVSSMVKYSNKSLQYLITFFICN
jgi:hypothetical protein